MTPAARAERVHREVLDSAADESGWRHFILEPQHVLSAADRADLAANGLEVQRALSQGRYLVRISADSTVSTDDPRVRSLEALTGIRKLQPSAYGDAARGRTYAHLKVLFNDDVSLDQARAAVIRAGGSVDQGLLVDFGPMRTLTVRIPSVSLQTFADDERVLSVYSARRARAKTMNAAAAQQSHVTEVQAAPFNLSGDGVALSYFELAPADTTHPEFQGRLTSHVTCLSGDTQCTDAGNILHATHTGGTMIAAGIVQPLAKGMAPKATLHEYEGADPQDRWLTLKQTGPRDVSSIADNSSFGFVWGWSTDGSTGWTWNDGDEFIGGYDGTLSSVIDHIALTNNTIFVVSAGNEADNTGPSDANFRHNHSDDHGNPTSDTYCYSKDGSGTDCPVAFCSAGAQFCETAHHPVHNPHGSINWMASMKNMIAVGATDSSFSITSFSSRGPAKDGRIKPEITAKGKSLFSTAPGGRYVSEQGTSMSAPVVTGTMALLVEQWRNTTGNAAGPGPLALKAIVLATADDEGNAGPDYTYGFGFLNARRAVDTIIADGGTGKRIRKDAAANGSLFDYSINLSSSQDLKVFLSWFDPEALPVGTQDLVSSALVNDLDLKVVGPNGSTTLPWVLNKDNPTANATHGVNTVDNNEEVDITGAAPGTYHVIVTGTRVIANSPQPFVVVSNADVAAAPPPCTDPTEPNDTPETAYGNLAVNLPVAARICSASDVDYFRFVTTATGTASAVVTARDTPLKVSLIVGGATLSTVNIAAGATQTLSTPITSTASTQVLLRVELNGTLGADGGYSVSVSYPFSGPPRRRSARH